ncbi:MAG: heavy metal translocating P-type ATPase [Rhizobiaceae bacterium]
MSCCGAPDEVVIPPSRERTNLFSEQEEKLRLHARATGENTLQSDFLVSSMHCAGCMRKIETGLKTLPFVKSARANLSTKRVSIHWDENMGRAEGLVEALEGVGFSPVPFDLELQVKESSNTGRNLLFATGVAGFAAANIMLLSVSVWSGAEPETARLFHLISGLIAVPAVAFSGQPFFRSAIASLKAGRLNMEVPISLAVLLSLGMSLYESLSGGEEAYFDAAVMLLFFLLIGRTLDHNMRERARGAISRLAKMGAKGATVLGANGDASFVPISEIAVGQHILIRAGERVPLDGVVIKGTSEFDRSLVTGESKTISVASGTNLESGILNLSAPIELEVTKTGDHSFLAEMINLMETAEQGKARYVRIADRLVQIYAPLVHFLALITFIGWMVASAGDWHQSIYVAIAVLIVTCPCALGLAVPIVHVVGAGRLFSSGIMVKDGSAFERLSEVDHVVFDKTGTLTLGTPQVLESTQTKPEERAIIHALASASSHPAAKAVAQYTQTDGTAIREIENLKEIPGFGISGNLDGKEIRLGRYDWVMEIANANTLTDNCREVCFAQAGHSAGGFAIDDSLRPDALTTIDALKQAGITVEILSGDSEGPVRIAAQALGVETYAHSRIPQQKIDRVNLLQQQGKKVLVVGDGLNDAPALAAAHVSMAPSSGSDVGKLAADVIFTTDSLQAVTIAIETAININALVRQNFAIAIIYNIIAVPLAMLGFVTPLLAAIAMSASSIIVIANSLRLNFLGKSMAVKVPPQAQAAKGFPTVEASQ